MMKKVDFMCTAFRDGFQSVYGARVLTPDFLPALEAAREAGIDYFEAGGGARFQSLYFYCQEDAFAMMDSFRATAGPAADLQTLSRGVNVVGLDTQSSDVIKLHAELFAKHGITTIRNFDALNDVQNLVHSGRCIVEAGLKHQVCVTMMALPPGCVGAHDAAFYTQTLQAILDAEIPFDSVCFKDASGTAVPATVFETIVQARRALPEGTKIQFHTHETAGIAVSAYQAALDAGVDAIDLSLAPVSGGTCQPDVLVMWHALRGTEYDLEIDVDKVREAESIFKECMADYFLPPEAVAVEPMIPWSPMPGGALTANTQMLRDNGIMDRYPEMIRAMGDVVTRGGFGTSVTPVSQFYFQQAFNNVMFGPWKKIAPDYGRMVLGYFGRTPVPPDAEIVKLAAEQLQMDPTTRPPLEMNDENPEKSVSRTRQRLAAEDLEVTDENIFIVAACGDKGVAFLKGEGEMGVRKIDTETPPSPAPTAIPEPASPAAAAVPDSPGHYTVTVDGAVHAAYVDGDRVEIDGRAFTVGVGAAEEGASPPPPSPAASMPASVAPAAGVPVEANMPGKVLRIEAGPGTTVHDGDAVIILEAMKMEVTVPSPVTGEVAQVLVSVGDQVATGAQLATVVPA
ncbi:MAG TPA: biotin/lipoyl-containing protein [Candidatus Latescibacteria bacterium]|jgi:pyruvate carboxylase subunit B|nr:biotin/lipoyl-containing protein [Candidatus Latescibacterota bacterium]HJP33877.1 biotin/lipoyl-containing protein [Candidatus Latescibacterota bacterium]|tara:strand:+ start:379 stop:2253 length:1875 start_codon:yes stop_codon:yes gene_type:complete